MELTLRAGSWKNFVRSWQKRYAPVFPRNIEKYFMDNFLLREEIGEQFPDSKIMNRDLCIFTNVYQYFQSHTTHFFIIVFYLATGRGSESSGHYTGTPKYIGNSVCQRWRFPPFTLEIYCLYMYTKCARVLSTYKGPKDIHNLHY